MKIIDFGKLNIDADLAEKLNYNDAMLFAYSKAAPLSNKLNGYIDVYNSLIDNSIEYKAQVHSIITQYYKGQTLTKNHIFMVSSDNTVNIYEVYGLPQRLICNVEHFFAGEIDAIEREYYLYERSLDTLTFATNKGMSDDVVKQLLNEYEEAACSLFFTSKAFEEFVGSTNFPLGLYEWSINHGRRVITLELRPEFAYLTQEGFNESK